MCRKCMCRMNHVHGPTELGYSGCVCPVGSRDFPRLWVASRRGSGVSPGAIREPRGAPAHLPNPRLHATFSYWSDTGAQARHWPSATSRPTVWLPQNGLPQLPKWATGSASDVLHTNGEMRRQLPLNFWRCAANGRCGAKLGQKKLAGEQRANPRAHLRRGAEIKSNLLISMRDEVDFRRGKKPFYESYIF